ncbi:MAG: hydrogenase maturation protease [Chloroflexi bacterium]|nr:hydrogenase maturation protease [Chloroflexota bacterium]
MRDERRVLVLGYGNLSREDDGIGFHVVNAVARRLGRPPLTLDDDGLSDLGQAVDLVFQPQLVPELAELIIDYDVVYFVDAHTGAYEETIRWERLEPGYVPSSFTHHLTPATLLEVASTLYGRAPVGYLVSVRGYRFGFGMELSPEAKELCEAAAEQIVANLPGGVPAVLKEAAQEF